MDWSCTQINPYIAGIALYYIIIQLLLWWLWHTIAVFWAVNWPFYAKKFNVSWKNRYLHIAFILASLLLPIAPILIVVYESTNPGQKGGFTITRSPPILCTGHDIHTNFWAMLFPMSLLLAIGVTLLVLTLRIVIKVINHTDVCMPLLIRQPFSSTETLFVKTSQNKGQYDMGSGDQSTSCSMLLCHPWYCSPHHLHHWPYWYLYT